MDQPGSEQFTWHPEYQGQSQLQVRDELQREIASDQRQYALALEGADQRENDVLKSVIELEKRWGPYDMGWTEADSGELADRIVGFEWAREERQELFPYAEYRETAAPPGAIPSGDDAPWWAFWRR